MTAAAPIALQCPPPGIYEDVPPDMYHSWPAASASRLSLLRRSPAHMRYAIDHPSEPTPAMRLGTAAHLAILQPELFEGRYLVAGRCVQLTAKGRGPQCTRPGVARWGGNWLCTQHALPLDPDRDMEIITADDATRIAGMVEALRAHGAASLFTTPCQGPAEVSAVWQDPETREGCKLRADKLCPALNVVVDVKTAEDASPDAFARSIETYGYARQAAHYLRGLAALGEAYESFVFVVIEKSPPHAVGVYRLDDESLELGDGQMRRALDTYAQCERSGVWPAYGDAIQDIRLPAWAFSKEQS